MPNPIYTYSLDLYDSFKYYNVSLTIQLNINHLLKHTEMIKQFYFKQFNLAWVNKVKWFQLLRCIANNSIKHQLLFFTHTQMISSISNNSV